jgi:DNA-binding transcriptional MocR family regulator
MASNRTADPRHPAAPTPRRGMRGSTQVIHRDLRERILNRELEAGSELTQAKVAADYGVSRAPVRDAFRLLEREGLLAAHANHRSRVTPCPWRTSSTSTPFGSRRRLTIFKAHFALLTVKAYSKGERVLRLEAITHNTKSLAGLPKIMSTRSAGYAL